jgi:trehalose 6-phosphate synthase/phosphatase
LPSSPRPGVEGSGRLVLVSNRLPVTIRREGGGYRVEPSAGGLASAVWPMHESGDGVWIGWPGVALDDPEESRAMRRLLRQRRLVPISLSEEQLQGFYEGFSNAVLWPLLHYFPHLMTLERSWWEAYVRVNRLYARSVMSAVRPGDVVWVHDYHLLLLPQMLRERLPDTQIGFFLHTPFPSSELFRILPWRRELLRGMLGASLVGFHSFDYLRHFRVSVNRVLGVEVEGDRVFVGDRRVRLGVFPVGIDSERYWRGATASAEARAEGEALHRQLDGRRLILGVDRMDYTKGIPERLLGYERFLERFPEHHRNVEFLQVGVPTRTHVRGYQALKRQVDEIVGRINGRYGSHDWTPVKYLYRPISFARLCALYRQASVGLITPLRDGMNLVAKEYVATHRDGEDGILILSEFAGAAAELSEAVLVNPYDPEAISDAIHDALRMSRRERRARMRALGERVREGDIGSWGPRFMAHLQRAGRGPAPYPPRLQGEVRADLRAAWRDALRRLLVLDYDGTLMGFAPRPEGASPDRELVRLLRLLTEGEGVDVAVISGRDRRTLARWVGGLPLTIVAEHGRWLRRVGGDWEDLFGGRAPSWYAEARQVLQEFASMTPGSMVEVKSASVVWHYRTANAELADLRRRELLQRLEELHGEPPPDVLEGNKIVEVRVRGINKGSALFPLLTGSRVPDFLLAAGDDQSDEELFHQLPPTAWTVLVGSRPSRARYSVADHRELRAVLRELAE